MNDFKDRLSQLIFKEFGGSQKDFSAKTGISESSVSEYLSGKKLSPRRLFWEKLKNALPHISQEWLNTGHGNMYLADEDSEYIKALEEENKVLKKLFSEITLRVAELERQIAELEKK